MLRGLRKFLASTVLATGLLIFVSVWSVLATFVAQGKDINPEVVAWASAHSAIEPVVRFLGLHQAFTSGVFLAAVLLLGVSTAVCSWQRTKVALRRSRALRMAAADEQATAAKPDSLIACASSLSAPEAASIAAETLARLGIKMKRNGNRLSAVSPWWSVWGSPVFHWSLVALIAIIAFGNLQRSDGLMAVAVGQTKPDEPGSYRQIEAGPWRDWSTVHRSIRVDSFEPDYRTGGIDRGPTPTVSILDGEGRALITQRVYPNMMLHSGSVSISAPACGLSVTMSLLRANGDVLGRTIQPIDFAQGEKDGTKPVGELVLSNSSGEPRYKIRVTVPLDRNGDQFGEWIPKDVRARLVVTSAQGTPVLDQVIRPGESIALPDGGRMRLEEIGWYSRLSIVDDWTTPYIYAAMIIATLGLTITVLARQQLLLVSVVDDSEGMRLALRMRLWRNVPTSRDEIESELSKALRGDENGSMS